MLKRFYAIALFLFFMVSVGLAQFTVTPRAYIEIYNGLPYPSQTCNYRIVIENPAGSSAEMTKVEINVPAGTGEYVFPSSASAYSISVKGTGASSSIQWFGGSQILRVTFSTPLTEGSKAYIYVTGVENPSVTGNYSFIGKAFVVGDTVGTDLVTPADKSLTIKIKNNEFKTIPKGRIEILESTGGVANGGIKMEGTGALSTFNYYLYNPPDSGDTITKASITLPTPWAVAVGTAIIDVIGTGAANPASVVAGAADAAKTPIIITFTTPLEPGSWAIITIRACTVSASPDNGNPVICEVEGNSGVTIKCQDFSDFSDVLVGQVPNIAGIPSPIVFSAGAYLVSKKTPQRISTYIANTPNNEYKVVLYKGAAWVAGDSPVIIDLPAGFKCGGATLTNQANGMVGLSTAWSNQTDGIIKVNFTSGAANVYPNITISGITNPSTEGTYTWNVYISNRPALLASPLTRGAPAYRLTSPIISKYIASAKFDVAITGGSSMINSRALYTIQIYNPIGDGIDKAFITIPAGYSSVSNVDINCGNSIGAGTATLTTAPTSTTPGLITVNFTTPMGENSSAYVRLYATNPSAEQEALWFVRVSGVADLTNILASDPDNEGESVSGAALITLPPEDTGEALISTAGGTATSADGNASLTILDAGIFASANISITPVNPDNVPSAVSQPNYIPVGIAYEFISDRSLVKKATVTIKYNDSIALNKVVDKFVLARYDNDAKEWKAGEEITVDKVNKTVSAKTYSLSKWQIFEYQPSDGTILSGLQIYPNPLGKNDTQVNIKFVLGQNATITMNIYDFGGRLIKKFTDQAMSAGVQNVVWDGKDNSSDQASNGVYFVKIIAKSGTGKEQTVSKIVVLK